MPINTTKRCVCRDAAAVIRMRPRSVSMSLAHLSLAACLLIVPCSSSRAPLQQRLTSTELVGVSAAHDSPTASQSALPGRSSSEKNLSPTNVAREDSTPAILQPRDSAPRDLAPATTELKAPRHSAPQGRSASLGALEANVDDAMHPQRGTSPENLQNEQDRSTWYLDSKFIEDMKSLVAAARRQLAAKGAAKAPAKAAAKGTSKGPAKTAPKGTPKGTTKGTGKGSSKSLNGKSRLAKFGTDGAALAATFIKYLKTQTTGYSNFATVLQMTACDKLLGQILDSYDVTILVPSNNMIGLNNARDKAIAQRLLFHMIAGIWKAKDLNSASGGAKFMTFDLFPKLPSVALYKSWKRGFSGTSRDVSGPYINKPNLYWAGTGTLIAHGINGFCKPYRYW